MKLIYASILGGLAFLLLSSKLQAQSASCPEVNINGAPQINFPCTSGPACTTLTAVIPDMRQTVDGPNAYIVTSADYNAHYPFQLPGATPIIVDQDDVYSGIINLPFTFCFYGGQYTQLVVGANGTMSFHTPYAFTFSHFSMEQDPWGVFGPVTPGLPETFQSYPRNGIFALFHDINPSLPTPNHGIEWKMEGQAPCRKLIINWRNIGQFSNPAETCGNLTSTFQCVLYENTNVIEMYVEKKPLCTVWNQGNAVIGVQNAARNQAVAAPGRNGTNWVTTTSTSEAWRFVPNGPSLLNNVQLLDASGSVVANGNPVPGAPGTLNVSFPNVCVSGVSTQFYVKASFSPCSGPSLEAIDSVLLVKTNAIDPPTVVSPLVYCVGQTPVPLTANGTNLLWYTVPTGGTGSSIAPLPATNSAGSTTYYVSQSGSTCESDRTPITVIVNPNTTHTINAAICQGGVYNFGGQNLTASGTYNHTFTTATCDSVVTLNLTVNPNVTNTVNAAICQGSSYSFGGQNLTTSGTYSHTFNSGSCDSVVTLNLTVNPNITNTINAAICQGSSYNLGGQNLTASGTYNHTFTTASCDSVVTLNLTVNPNITNTVNAAICQGSSYSFGDQNLTTSGTYNHTFTTASCDSVVTLTLTVNPNVTNTVNAAICQGSSYSFGGQNLTTSGMYNHTFTTATCDSVVTLTLTVNPNVTNTVNAAICQGSSYSFGGQNLTASGTYNHTFTTASCDSVVTLTLTVNPNVTNTVNAAICQGSSYSFGGQNLTTSGTYNHTFTTATCDSVVTLNLTVNPNITNTINAAICQGSSYSFGDQNLTTSGTYNHTFTTASCDSVVTLNLTVNPNVTNTVNAAICQGSSYSFGGQNLTASGTYNHTFTTATCDSVVTLHLTVNPNVTNTVNAAICQGSSYSFGGQNLTTSGTYNHTFTTASCDSVVTLNLTVNPNITNTVNAVICQGSSYSFGGQNLTTSGMYNHTFTTTSCDSVVTLNLTVNPNVTNTVNTAICQGNSYSFGGQNLTTSGTYNHTFTTITGCDSVVTLQLTMLPLVTTSLTQSICAGDTYPFGGQLLSASGTYTHAFPGSSGCDSIVTLILTVNSVDSSFNNAVICEGDVFLFGNLSLNTTGVYTQTFPTATCDSVAVLSLQVNGPVVNQVHMTLCDNQLPFIWNGTIINAPGNAVATFTTQSVSGCDSTVILNLEVLPPPLSLHIDTATCGYLIFEGETYSESTLIQDTLFNYLGCDSLYRNLQITIYPQDIQEVLIDTFGCDRVDFEGKTYTENTILEDTFISIHGCDSLHRQVNIIVEHFNLELTSSFDSAYQGETIVLTTTANVPYDIYAWGPASWFSDQSAFVQYWKAQQSGVISVHGESRAGCPDSAEVYLDVLPFNSGIFIPNAFSPNGDGLNDYFGPAFWVTRGYTINAFRIFNRYGQIVYQSASAEDKGWDGRFKGKDCDIGTYFYQVDVDFLNGINTTVRGDLSLVR